MREASRRCEPGGGIPGVLGEHRRGDRELQRRRGREARPRVPRRAAAAGEALDVDAGRAREAARERRDLARERGVLARSDDPRARARGQAEDVVDVR